MSQNETDNFEDAKKSIGASRTVEDVLSQNDKEELKPKGDFDPTSRGDENGETR